VGTNSVLREIRPVYEKRTLVCAAAAFGPAYSILGGTATPGCALGLIGSIRTAGVTVLQLDSFVGRGFSSGLRSPVDSTGVPKPDRDINHYE
jgi:hypothetical protein